MMFHTVICALLASTVVAIPTPQGVTEAITPGTATPANCLTSWQGTFGMTVMNYTGSADSQPGISQQTSQIADGQVQATNQIADGQVQNQQATNQIADGQVQQQQPTNQIADGQVQQQQPTNQIADGQVQQQQATNQIADGQVQQQQPTNQIADGQVQQQQPTNQIADGQVQQQQATNQIADGQVQQQATNQIADGQVQQQSSGSSNTSSTSVMMQGCQRSDSLILTLQNGILKDGLGRIGYIADNRQFQFDGPPQAGALVTAGWSICGGVLALGNQTIFFQCLSGTFYNLYDTSQGEQCNQVTFNVLQFVKC